MTTAATTSRWLIWLASAGVSLTLGIPQRLLAQQPSGRPFAPLELRPSYDNKEAALLAAKQRIVYFDFDSFVISSEARFIIEAHGRYLSADPKLHVALEGHTDDRGVREYSLGLGQKRADAVKKALSLMGVEDSQMESVSFGHEKPPVPGTSEAAMRENRRVEINYR